MSSRSIAWEERPDTLSYDYVADKYASSGNGNSDIYWVDAGFIEELRREAWD